MWVQLKGEQLKVRSRLIMAKLWIEILWMTWIRGKNTISLIIFSLFTVLLRMCQLEIRLYAKSGTTKSNIYLIIKYRKRINIWCHLECSYRSIDGHLLNHRTDLWWPHTVQLTPSVFMLLLLVFTATHSGHPFNWFAVQVLLFALYWPIKN